MIAAAKVILDHLWPALVAATLLGIPFGAASWRERPAGFWGRLGIILALAALLAGSAIVLAGRVPGRFGLWLEIGVAVAFAYLLGCVVGSLAGSLRRPVAGAEHAAPRLDSARID